MNKQLPPHLQAIFDKRNAFFKKCGCERDPAEDIIEALNKAKKVGDDDSLTHAIIA